MRPWILALAACGCRGLLGIETPIDATDSTVVPIDAPAACTLWHPQGFEPCALGAAMPALDLPAGNYLYDTTTAGGKLSEIRPDTTTRQILASDLTVMQSDGTTVATLWVESFTLRAGATLRVIGVKPLLVVGWTAIQIDGALDASSHIGAPQPGAGANQACPAPATLQGTDAPPLGGSGGGGGGGHNGAGAPGGAAMTTAGGSGGAAVNATVARGGCPGGSSGAAGKVAQPPASEFSVAAGGSGGGALRLVAHDIISVAGSISASGAGGAGSPRRSGCGGGGGGTGGYLALDAPSVKVTGILAANGGGGGGGGAPGGDPGDEGSPGSDGRLDLQPASGGTASAGGCGRPGGTGATGTVPATAGLPFSTPTLACPQAGGGGGGGAAGFIVITTQGFAPATSATISPAPTLP
jgi:hypothetical protein